jgi:poly(ADP-ribose) glycohydrolase ARH3
LDNWKNVFQYTDDTALTKAVCESLIQSKGLDMSNLAKELVTKYENEPNRGYAAGAICLFEELSFQKSKNNLAEKCLKPSLNLFNGTGSFGNGSGMRITPISLYTYNQSEKEMIITAVLATSVTHSHYLSLVGGLLQCYAVRFAFDTEIVAFENEPSIFLTKFLDGMIEFIKYVEKNLLNIIKEAIEGNIKDVCKDMKFHLSWLEKRLEIQTKDEKNLNAYSKRLEILKSLFQEYQKGNIIKLDNFHKNYAKCDVTALESIPVALFAFIVASDPKCENEVNSKLHTEISFTKYDNFERTILYAVSLGGDTDTIASMAGAIAGAFYGSCTNSNSKSLFKKCEEYSHMYNYAEELFKLNNFIIL